MPWVTSGSLFSPKAKKSTSEGAHVSWFKKKETPPSEEKVMDALWSKCNACQEIIYKKELERNLHVCPKCSYHFPIQAHNRVAIVADDDSFKELDRELAPVDPILFRDLKRYSDRLHDAQHKTGLKDAFTTGKLVHLMALEPHRVADLEVVDVQSKNTKAWKEASARNPEAVTAKEMSDAQRVADALMRNDRAMAYFEGCEFEVPRLAELEGLPFRGKADAYDGEFIIDLKTTSDLRAFPYSAKKYSYDLQLFIYCQMFEVPYDKFIFIAIDKSSLDVGIYTATENFYKSGQDKFNRAIDLYNAFFVDCIEDIDSYTIIGQLD